MKITLFDEKISDFYEILLYDTLHKLSEKSNWTCIKNIVPFEILKPTIVFLPPVNEQKRIISKLIDINLLIEK